MHVVAISAALAGYGSRPRCLITQSKPVRSGLRAARGRADRRRYIDEGTGTLPNTRGSQAISAATTGARPRSACCCWWSSTSRHPIHRRSSSNISPHSADRCSAPARGGIYQPFAWVVWGWHNSTSQDPRIRKPLFIGEMIVFAGSFLCVAIFFVLANRRARKLMENAEDLHGSARWANEDGYPRTPVSLTRTHGVYVGGWCAEGSTPAALPPAQRPGTHSRVRANPLRQRRRPGDSDAAGMGGIGGRSTTSRVRTGPRRPASARSRAISVSSSRRLKKRAVRGSIRCPRSACSLRAMSPTRRTSRT